MKCIIHAVAISLTLVSSVALAQGGPAKPDLSVSQPLTQIEKTCAAKLTRLRSARLWWNDDNRIVGVALKGTDATNRSVALSSHLPGLRALVLVALPQNNLTNDGLAPLATLPQLRLLSISGDRITDGALRHVQAISTLEVLVLNGNFTDEAIEAISPLQQLQQLDLTQSHITDAGLTHVAKLVNLQTLILNSTSVSNQGLASIAQLKRLTKLYLGDTKLNDDAVPQLKKLEQLEQLFIKRTDITAEGVASLVPGLPTTCKIIHESGTYFGQRPPRTAMAQANATQWRAAQ